MKAKHQRLIFLCLTLLSFIGATFFILRAFNDNLIFFYSPTDAQTKPLTSQRLIRIGGLVEPGSFKSKGPNNSFIVTDFKNKISVNYSGLLPSLFREGKGVVAEGYLVNKETFEAKTILAKHDENYMPPQIEKSLYKDDIKNDQ